MEKAKILLLMAVGMPVPLASAVAEQAGRYTMERVDEGMLRLDTQTGAVSLCRRQDEQWSCSLVPGSQLKMQRELEKLGAENRALRTEVEKLRGAARQAEQALAAKKQDRLPQPPQFEPPTDETIDEMMDVLEKMVRRFRGMIDSLQKEPPEEKKL